MRKHYSDEQLLAHLDGELRGWTERRVFAHLKACWSCRARQAELESQIQGLAEAFHQTGCPNPEWVAESKLRFREWREALDSSSALSPRPHWLFLFPSIARMTMAAVLLCAVIGVWRFTSSSPAGPPTSVILGGAKRAELELQQVAFHQSFRVEIAEHVPNEKTYTSRVEVWSDPSGSRFASRWEDDGGLRYGAWRPGGDRQEYVHNPRNNEVSNSGESLTDAAESVTNRADLEAAFLQWLESRRWKPISIADDVAMFVSKEGVALRAERLPDGGLRVTAARKRRGVTVELMMQVEEGNYRPRVQRMRLEGPEVAMELSLIAERIETFGPGTIEPTVFVPNLSKQPADFWASTKRLPEPARPSEPLVNADVDHPEAVAHEIEVYYALHRIGACLGEPIEVAELPPGRFVVRGLAETAARRDEIQAALRELPFVEFAIRTVDEVVATTAPGAASESVLPETARVSRRDPLLQEILLRHYRQTVPETEIPAKVAALSNEATLLSSAIMSDVWSLRRIAEEFPDKKTIGLHGTVRWALEDMVRDHLHSVRQGASRLSRTLAPLIPAGSSGGAETERAGLDSDWVEKAARLFDVSRRTDELMRAIFAGAPQQDGWDLRAAVVELRDSIGQIEALSASK